MLATEHELNDLAIYWPNRKKALAVIERTGKCPSHAVPRKLRPNGVVALVAKDGQVLILFRIATIQEGVSVIAADGKRYKNGCLLVAKTGTMRRPRRSDPSQLSVNRHGMGAFAYFDASKHQRVVYSIGGEAGQGQTGGKSFPSKPYALFANNIGKTLSQPERLLIRQFTSWVGDVTMFAHHPLKKTGLYTDLFVPSRWTLFEAKATVARRTLREAIGQLFDYQRHYDRPPSIAVLLPERPAETVMELFKKKRIGVVWKSRGGSFADSAEGALTRDLRAKARKG